MNISHVVGGQRAVAKVTVAVETKPFTATTQYFINLSNGQSPEPIQPHQHEQSVRRHFNTGYCSSEPKRARIMKLNNFHTQNKNLMKKKGKGLIAIKLLHFCVWHWLLIYYSGGPLDIDDFKGKHECSDIFLHLCSRNLAVFHNSEIFEIIAKCYENLLLTSETWNCLLQAETVLVTPFDTFTWYCCSRTALSSFRDHPNPVHEGMFGLTMCTLSSMA